MSIAPIKKASLTLDKDHRFRLVVVEKMGDRLLKKIRYPKVQLLKNRIRVGCITVSRAAAKELLHYRDIGFVQAEGE